MNCEFCKKNKANVNIIKVINGETERINLCIDCLKKFTQLPAEDFFKDLGDILKKVMEVDIKISDKGEIEKIFGTIDASGNKTCSFCLTDLNTIKAMGSVGCANCYLEFKDNFIKVLLQQ